MVALAPTPLFRGWEVARTEVVSAGETGGWGQFRSRSETSYKGSALSVAGFLTESQRAPVPRSCPSALSLAGHPARAGGPCTGQEPQPLPRESFQEYVAI